MRTVSVLWLLLLSLFVFSACTNEDDSIPGGGVDSTTSASSSGGGGVGDDAQVGSAIFADPNLGAAGLTTAMVGAAAVAPGMACADCHASTSGFAEPDSSLPVSEGVVAGRFGSRNSPSCAYASYSPPLQQVVDAIHGGFVYKGGYFWDGHGASLVDQTAEPLLNPLEMNNPGRVNVIAAVAGAPYANRFEHVYGPGVLADSDTVAVFGLIGEALASYEASTLVNRFSSRYDYWLVGFTALNEAQERGLTAFNAHCASCHPSARAPSGRAPLFTNFEYFNLGLPRNPANPFYLLPPELNPDGWAYVDLGLGGWLGAAAEQGKFKTPSLRNVALTAPYGHNGAFSTLHETIVFIGARDLAGAGWAAPEVGANVETPATGNMGLTAGEIADLEEFLRTLTDRFGPPLGENLDRLNR